jgi:tetratricopeptide (TPR) repeat protein
MKKVLLFLVIVLLSSNITFSKGFFQKLKDIKTIGYEIKATKSFINNDLHKDKRPFYLNLKYTRKKRNKLILSLLPFFKGKQAFDIIDEINFSKDIWCYKQTVDTLIEYSFNLDNRNELNAKLLALKQKIENSIDDTDFILDIREYQDDLAKAMEYFNKRDYENAIFYIEKTIPQLEAIISDPSMPPFMTIQLKMYVKSMYMMLGISYTYVIPPGTAEEYKYVEARDASQKAMDKYPEFFETMKMNTYSSISRTYFFEKDADNTEKYYNKFIETQAILDVDVPQDTKEMTKVDILMLRGSQNYDEALEIINNFIPTFNPDPDFPKLGFIMAYYNRAVINGDKSQFDTIEADLQKCLEYINEHFDPPNDNFPAVQDEVEYYERLIERFAIIRFRDIEGNDRKNPILYITDDNLNHGTVENRPDVQLHIEIENSNSIPVKSFIPQKINLIYNSVDENTSPQHQALYYVSSNDEYKLYENVSKTFSLKIFEENEDHVIVSIITDQNRETPTFKLNLLKAGTAYKAYSNWFYDKNDPKDDTYVKQSDEAFKIIYRSFGKETPAFIPAFVKLKNDDTEHSVNLNKNEDGIYISEHWYLVVSKKTFDFISYIKMNNEGKESSILFRTKNNDALTETQILMPAFVGLVSDPSICAKDSVSDNVKQITTTLHEQGNYTVIPDYSVTGDEFNKYLGYSSIIYIDSHGIASMAKNDSDEIETVDFRGLLLDTVYSSKTPKSYISYNSDGDTVEINNVILFDSDDIKEKNILEKDIVFLNACFSANGIPKNCSSLDQVTDENVKGFITKLKPKLYIGWHSPANISNSTEFAERFFRYAIIDKLSVKSAYDEAKNILDEKNKKSIRTYPDIKFIDDFYIGYNENELE